MKGNQFYLDGRLYRFDYSAASAPWPLQVWDDADGTWQDIGRRVPKASSAGPLTLSVGQDTLLDWAYLADMDGLAVLTATGEPIATQWPSAAAQPELVLTATGDIIRCD